ncbi:MAG: 1-acyl-sn-glycerol-3-phosphate acyltransferase [Clostridia bacterium]|nr:1-acyl-sn-glycerol-3-phosphate acyltransferase [Clostridia bacterium]
MSNKEKNIKRPEDRETGFRVIRSIINPLFKFYYTPEIIGAENIPEEGAIVVAGNHMHIMDQCHIFLATERTIHYIAKKEYFDGKFAWFFRLAGCIPVDRSRKDLSCAMSAMKVLKKDGAIGIFPEGTRNKTDKFLLPFKSGAVSMAQKTGAKIVPFGVAGNYKFRSKNLRVVIGKPFDPSKMTTEEAREKLRDEIGRLMKEAAGENTAKAKRKGA